MGIVKLPQQETFKMENQMMHKVIIIKMVPTMCKLNLNSTMKKEVKTILHKLTIMILQSIMTMMIKMMAPSKDQLKCHILECINPFDGTILLITY
jgi:hypothetical protein